MEQHTVIVVGAGPAGLATASRLHRAGLRPVVLERADAVGASWRGRYDRLRLNSPRWYSTVPGGRWRPGTRGLPVARRRRRAPRDLRRGRGHRRPARRRRRLRSTATATPGSSRPPPATCARPTSSSRRGAPTSPTCRRGRAAIASPACCCTPPSTARPAPTAGATCSSRRRLHGRGDRVRPRRRRGGTGPPRGAHAAEHHAPRADRRAARGRAVRASPTPISDAVARSCAAVRSATSPRTACPSRRRASSAACAGCTSRR